MVNLKKFCVIIGVLFCLLFLSLIIVTAQEIKILNSATNELVSAKSYEIINVYSDSTFNTYYYFVKNKSKSQIVFKNEREFQIWDYSVEIDGKQVKFIPRPMIGDPIPEYDNQYYFEDSILFDNSTEHLIKITFWMNNVLKEVGWFPFDYYRLFINDRQVSEDSSIITKFIFHGIDTKRSAKITNEAVINFDKNKKEKITAYHKLISVQDVIITSESSMLNGSMGGISLKSYIQTAEGLIESPFSLYVIQQAQVRKINFRRTFFPSILLFILLGAYTIFITIYNYYLNKNAKNRLERYYNIYINLLLPTILVEFSISFLPPWRPLEPTLFDSIILWPILPLGVDGLRILLQKISLYMKKINLVRKVCLTPNPTLNKPL